MKLKIDNEFKNICINIIKENKTNKEWSEIPSCDMFQSDRYCGGYENLERAFCFSYYDSLGQEFWFQITLNDVDKITKGRIKEINIRIPE